VGTAARGQAAARAAAAPAALKAVAGSGSSYGSIGEGDLFPFDLKSLSKISISTHSHLGLRFHNLFFKHT